MELDKTYWNNRYLNDDARWNIGYPSTPLKTYIDQLEDKTIRILVPGAGNAYEVEYLWQQGFTNVYLLDFSEKALQNFKERVPDFPNNQLVLGDFFEHEAHYDLILEQTFFCAIHPILRKAYAEKMRHLLTKDGKLVGLLFDAPLNTDHPPFGGDKEEYLNYFESLFDILSFDLSYNSIAARGERELFIRLSPKK